VRRPAFQFYAGEWLGNAKLKRCTKAEKGIWIDTLCLLHDSEEEYGVIRWPLKELAQAVGCKVSELQTIRRKGVLKGADVGERCAAFVFAPRHGGKEGEPVVLIPEQDGPIWYSSRMVRDEYIRARRGESTRFEAPKDIPKGGFGGGQGDGPSSSTSTSVHLTTSPEVVVPDGPPDCPHDRIIELYHELMPTNPRVLEWNDTRRGYLRARWREKAKPNGRTQGYTTTDAGITFWRRFFAYCAESKFLTGQSDGRPGRPPFVADLEWLMKPGNFAKVIEGKYHQ
jgi:hypothetical protein